MTTLPQTTTLRLPRPASTQIAIPGAPMLHGPSAAPLGNIMTAADVWRVIRGNLWLILLLLVVSAAAGYGANVWLARYYSRYTAIGLVQINPPAHLNPLKNGETAGIDPGALELELRTQAMEMKHLSLISKIIENSDVRGTAWFQSFQGNVQKAKEDLADSLDVNPSPSTKLIQVGMTYRDPKSCSVIVEALVNQHIHNQQQVSENKQANRSQALQFRRTLYQAQLNDVTSQLHDKEVSLANLGGRTADSISTKDIELSQLITGQLRAQMTEQAAKDQYEGLKAQIAAGQVPARVEQAVSIDPDVVRAKDSVNQLKIAMASAKDDYGADHPEMKRLQSRLDLYQRQLEDATAEARSKAQNIALDTANGEYIAAKHEYDAITQRVQGIHNDMDEISRQYGEYLTLRDRAAGLSELLKQYQEQLDDLTAVQTRQDQAMVDWYAHPEVPDSPSFPRLKLTMTLAILIGLALSLGIAFLREVMDTSVRSPRDISRVGALNLLGIVPHEADDPQAVGSKLPLVIFEAPASMLAEQLRQVRTRLQHSSSLDTTRTLLVTSPGPGDGKTTIAANLASGLALNGRRILLVDANFHRPGLHKVFNASNDHGFSDVLNSLDQFESTVQETQVPNLYLLPSGPKPTNATELLESQLLLDFIERALEEFDHVIFDSGPIMFVSETVALAPRVDGVVSVVRARHNSRGVLQRMRDTLRQVKAEHLGVILNAVRSQGGGYYARNIRTYYDYQNQNGRAA